MTPVRRPLVDQGAAAGHGRPVLFKNFWYVLAESEAVTGTPSKARALGQDFALMRRASDGCVIALADRCVHRMGSLAAGERVGDCLRCPYHGWTYAADGACTQIPANPAGTPVPRKARVDSYPVEERHGWVWVFLGDLPEAERPPIPALPEFGTPPWRAVRGQFTWKAHYTRVVENAVDVAHTPFVHRDSFGDLERPVMPAYAVQWQPHGVEASVSLAARDMPLFGSARENQVRLVIHAPSVNRLDGSFARGWQTILLLAHTPIDEHETRTYFVQLRNFMTTRLADALARRLSQRILVEDRPTVESQSPSCISLDARDELSTRSDALSLAYRKLLRRYVELGWCLDADPQRGGRLRMIPSPQRRAPGLDAAWVLGERGPA